MSEWVLSACGIIILTAILHNLIPQGKTGKIIKSIFAIICISVLIKPVLNLKSADFDFSSAFSVSEINLQDDYLYFTLKKKSEYLSESVTSYIKQINDDIDKTEIELCYDDDFNVSTKKVRVYIKNGVMIENSEHIVIIDRAFEYLSAYAKTDKRVIEIYG